MNTISEDSFEQHLQRYCTEFDFRYNVRKLTDVERAELLFKGVQGKRLTYRPTNAQV